MQATDADDMTIPIELCSGKLVDLEAFDPRDVDVFDIAHALSNLCRWTGHTIRFYSVAEHSVRVSKLAESYAIDNDMAAELVELVALDGLLHDAAEAYPPGDLAAPLKRALDELRDAVHGGAMEYQARVDAAIRERFGLPPTMAKLARKADRVLLATEARDLMRGDWMPPDVEPLAAELRTPWPPDVAELRYLLRFQQLVGPGELGRELGRLIPAIGPDGGEYDRADRLLLRLVVGELEAHETE